MHQYTDRANRELVGFIAACFAYGRVQMIMTTVDRILKALGPDPAGFLSGCTRKDLKGMFTGFRYRFADDKDLVGLLTGLRSVLKKFESLENCFNAGIAKGDETILSGLQYLSDQIRDNNGIGHLLADPCKKSACKRSHLFLRWMVRKDRVDLGCWDTVPASRLIVPLDRHMHTAGTILGFTKRKSADLKTALEITKGFRTLEKNDPIKYDFCLTRFGIREELNMETLKGLVRH